MGDRRKAYVVGPRADLQVPFSDDPEKVLAHLKKAKFNDVFMKNGYVLGCEATRQGVVITQGLEVAGLRRFKDDVTEVREGFECGIGLGSFNDIKVDDVIETFEMREKPRA